MSDSKKETSREVNLQKRQMSELFVTFLAE